MPRQAAGEGLVLAAGGPNPSPWLQEGGSRARCPQVPPQHGVKLAASQDWGLTSGSLQGSPRLSVTAVHRLKGISHSCL